MYSLFFVFRTDQRFYQRLTLAVTTSLSPPALEPLVAGLAGDADLGGRDGLSQAGLLNGVPGLLAKVLGDWPCRSTVGSGFARRISHHLAFPSVRWCVLRVTTSAIRTVANAARTPWSKDR